MMSDVEPGKKLVGQRMSIEQLWWYAQQIANSEFVPRNLRGKPNEIFITMQYGSELGISPMAALHGIAIINNTPSVYGDLLVSLMITHKDFEDFKFEFSDIQGDRVCYCHVKRKNRELFTSKYSMSDARTAKLIDKQVWRQYPDLMLMRRSLNTAFHYVFPDALYVGLTTIDTPYNTDNVDRETLVSATPASSYVVQDKVLSENTDKLDGVKPAPLAVSTKHSIAGKSGVNFKSDIAVNPKLQSKAIGDSKPPPPKQVRDSLKQSNKDISLPSVEEATPCFGELNPIRKDILDFYVEFLKLPDDERKCHYGTLLNTLFVYVNCDDVNAKAITILNKYVSCNLLSVSDICWGSVDEVPEEILCKMVRRLIFHWVPERISLASLFFSTCKNVCIPDTFFISRSEFSSNKELNSYSDRTSFSLPVRQECIDIVLNAIPASDYCSIEITYLPPIIEDALDFSSQSFSASLIDFISADKAAKLLELCSQFKVSYFSVLRPFCVYPDIRLLKNHHFDNVVKYVNYLSVVSHDGLVYPNPSQVLDIISAAVDNKTDVYDIVLECTGNANLDISSVPLLMLRQFSYLDFLFDK